MISRRKTIQLIASTTASAMAFSLFANPNHQEKMEKDSNYSIIPSSPIKIGVIGAGWLGGTVGRCLVQAGYEVMFSARNLDKVRQDIRGLGNNAKVGTPEQAAKFGNVLLFATPHSALEQVAQELRPFTQGKIIMDATNTNGNDPMVVARANGNVALLNAQFFPDSYLVRVFSSVDATQIEASFKRNGQNPLAIPIASDYPQALSLVAQLVQAIHCSPVSVGKLENAILFQRGTPAFRRHTNETEMRQLLQLPSNTSQKSTIKQFIAYL